MQFIKSWKRIAVLLWWVVSVSLWLFKCIIELLVSLHRHIGPRWDQRAGLLNVYIINILKKKNSILAKRKDTMDGSRNQESFQGDFYPCGLISFIQMMKLGTSLWSLTSVEVRCKAAHFQSDSGQLRVHIYWSLVAKIGPLERKCHLSGAKHRKASAGCLDIDTALK